MTLQLFQENQRRSMIQRLLEAHGKKTLQELKNEFQLQNQKVPFTAGGDKAFHEWLKSIDGVGSRIINGTSEYFYEPPVESKRKNTSPLPSFCRKTPRKNATPEPEFDRCQITSTTIKNHRHQQKFVRRNEQHDIPNLYNCVLIGDDNFLNLAVFDLNYRTKAYAPNRESGHCVSGLRISDATERLYELDESVKYVIVNVGSVDIAEGRQLIHLIDDMVKLLVTCNCIGITPILTTLAPLPNYLLGNKKEILNGFNLFIRSNLSMRVAVIDLNLCMLRSNASVDVNFYQSGPRYVRGSKKSFVLWNKLGRTRILNMLLKNLGEALVHGSDFIGAYF